MLSKPFLWRVACHTHIETFLNTSVLWIHIPKFLTLTPNLLVEFNYVDVVTGFRISFCQNNAFSDMTLKSHITFLKAKKGPCFNEIEQIFTPFTRVTRLLLIIPRHAVFDASILHHPHAASAGSNGGARLWPPMCRRSSSRGARCMASIFL